MPDVNRNDPRGTIVEWREGSSESRQLAIGVITGDYRPGERVDAVLLHRFRHPGMLFTGYAELTRDLQYPEVEDADS